MHTLLKGGEMMIHQPSSQNDALRAKGMGIDPCGPPHRLQGLVNDSGSFRMPILGRLKKRLGRGTSQEVLPLAPYQDLSLSGLIQGAIDP